MKNNEKCKYCGSKIEYCHLGEYCSNPECGYVDGHYFPKESEGTKIAAKIRSKCNKLSAEEREKLLDNAIKRIYNLKIEFIEIGKND